MPGRFAATAASSSVAGSATACAAVPWHGPRFAFSSSSSVRSWRRRWAASGLLPCLPAPSTSAGSRRSGFCAGGSSAAGLPSGLAASWASARASRRGGRVRRRRCRRPSCGRTALILGADHGHFAADAPGPMYFSRPIAPASGPGRRAVSTATAVSAAVDVAASGVSTRRARFFERLGRRFGADGAARLRRDDDRHLARARRLGWALRRRRRGFRSASACRCRRLKNCLTFSASSSVRLASADPLPGTPAFVQMSTSSLLSSFSSFANA